MKNLLIIAALAGLLSVPLAYADVFKCKLANGNTVYQHAPCLDAVNVTEVPVKKIDPAKAAKAKNDLEIWQANIKAKEAAEAKELKEQEEAAIIRQTAYLNANAQNEQAYQLKREADARFEGNRISAIANGIYFKTR